MPYPSVVTNRNKLLRGAFEDVSFPVPVSSQPGLSGTYQSQRFVSPPFFSQPGGMGFDSTWFTDPAQALLPAIGGVTIPNWALLAVPAAFLLMGRRRGR